MHISKVYDGEAQACAWNTESLRAIRDENAMTLAKSTNDVCDRTGRKQLMQKQPTKTVGAEYSCLYNGDRRGATVQTCKLKRSDSRY